MEAGPANQRSAREMDAEEAQRKAEAAHDRALRAAASAAESLEKSALAFEHVAEVQERADRHSSRHPDEDYLSASLHREDARRDRALAAEKRQEAATE
jgi:hypothetical protein